ncbi:MAG TPA: hypothetical protein DCS43_17570 [Verrucomicrobia bacterium]|nr:hypothetical protein [Verrucomicrobiota bacterium]
MLLKFAKWLVGILLLPVCVVASLVFWGLLQAVAQAHGGATVLPVPALALVGGFGLWMVIFALFPSPARSYILAHELTHALWGLMMGASISKISVHDDHGAVVLSKTNFLITLAPYFFPLYTVLVIGLYYLLWLFYPVERYDLVWLGLIGFTWSFHLTFTVTALLQRQSDIRDQGRLFSYTVIYLANIIGICAWVVLVSSASPADVLRLTERATYRTCGWCVHLVNVIEPRVRVVKASVMHALNL